MHTLISQLDNVRQARFCKISRSLNNWAALMPGGLIESQVQGQPYVGFNALVLSTAERDELAHLTRIFGSIFTKALAAIVSDPVYNLSQLGWPQSLVQSLRLEPPNRWLTPLGRFDFVLDPQNRWQLLEFNSDTPSGTQEASQIEAHLLRQLARFCHQPELSSLNPKLDITIAKALVEEATFPPVPSGKIAPPAPKRLPSIGFLARGRYLTDLAQVLYYEGILQTHYPDLNCTVGDPDNLALINNRLTLLGKPIDALYRLFPIEAFLFDPIFAAYTQANLNGSFKCLNNLRGFLAQSKAVMAWVWKERHNTALFDQTERDALASHLPPTWFVTDLPLSEADPQLPVGSPFDQAEPFRLSDFMFKEFFGREGAEVFDGANLTAEQWQNLRSAGSCVAQRKIAIPTLPHFRLNAAEQLISGAVTPCVGSFLIGNEWGGCYSRIGNPITDSSAQFVPTICLPD